MPLDQRWLYATIAIVAGFAIGAVLAAIARRALGRAEDRPAITAVANPTAAFLFWLSVATGIVTAIGFTSPDTLRPIPASVLSWLPGALAAGLILLAGYAAGTALASAGGAAVQRATRHRPTSVERAIRWVIMAAALVLALGNLGVETTSLQILIAASVASIGLAFALLAGLGGRDVAANIASGRTLRSDLNVGDRLRVGDTDGTIVALRPAVAILETERGRTILPLAVLLQEPFDVVPAGSSADHR